MVDIPTNKKEVAKLIFKTAKEAFRRGYRAYKKSKRTHEAYKGKQRQRGDASEGVIPYNKEHIKKAIRSVKFQGRAAKLAKKQKKPPGAKARGISFVGKGYQGDKTKSMQVPMITKLERREIQKSIGRSVKKFMKEKIGRKKDGGTMSVGETFKKNVPFSFWTSPEYKWKKWWLGPYKQAQKVDKFIEKIKKGECPPGWKSDGKGWKSRCTKPNPLYKGQPIRPVQKKEGGLPFDWAGKAAREKSKKKSDEEYYFKFREELEKRRKRRQWKRDMEQDLKRHKQHTKGVWVSKGGLLRKPKLAKRGF